jgi:Fe-S-cluster-containing hydrogenase component 2
MNMMSITVDRKRCPQNHPCPAVRVCPVGAIRQKGFELPVIDQEKCIKCKKCTAFCPMKAIEEAG